MSWPLLARILVWIVAIAVVVLLACIIIIDEAFKPGTPLSRWQQRRETARITTVLERPQVLDGIPFPARTEIVWEDPSHRHVAAARLPLPAEILGVRATTLRRVSEGAWIVSLAEAREIDGWACVEGEVELTATGRLWDCELSGTPSWRGWTLPERTGVRPRPDIHQVWLTLPFASPLDMPLASPVVGKLPWIVALNEDGSPFGARYAREAPYRVGGQEISGDVRWEYDPATYGMGRERPPVAVSGFVQAGGTRQPVVLPWPGSATARREESR
ncbi:hypothetical protein EAH89_13640 [Roseomonas nepalensis]|uniref:Uncharacterized protein n=1 Tax=Muricoccus nepalensis TaxID=1854500 RepID=A0A502G322_9PROT|nr:hypothetical protein [Roseomonas nepalensis]TPG55972.1 hypothetical protein EAH89_13640 [Roseomonas nepalensis]